MEATKIDWMNQDSLGRGSRMWVGVNSRALGEGVMSGGGKEELAELTD